MVLVAEVGRKAKIAAPPVETGQKGVEPAAFAVNLCIAFAVHADDAQARGLVVAKTAGHVEVSGFLAALCPAEIDLRQGIVRSALGQEVDAAADAGVPRRSAGQEGARATQDFDALEQFGGDVLPGKQAVEAIVGNVVRTEDKPRMK